MACSAALFIDGSNFYHSLKASRRLPFPATDYDLLFSNLSKQFGYDLKEIMFYDAVKDSLRDKIGYARQQQFHSAIMKLGRPIRIRTRKLRYVMVNDKPATKEKGIDVLLVVDMIKATLSKKYDTLILLSGDADFAPAVEFVKSLKINVVNLHAYSGSSTELRKICNKHILIDFEGSKIVLS